jgi:hypothetical protein
MLVLNQYSVMFNVDVSLALPGIIQQNLLPPECSYRVASSRVPLMIVVYVPPPCVYICSVSLPVPLDSTTLRGKSTGAL